MSTEASKTEIEREKRIKKPEQKTQGLWDNNRKGNTPVLGIPD